MANAGVEAVPDAAGNPAEAQAGNVRSVTAPPGGIVNRRAPWILFFVVLIVHGLSPVSQVGDSRLSLATALSVVTEGDLDLDEYSSVRDIPDRADVTVIDGHAYWAFPWPSALALIPVAAIGKAVHFADSNLDLRRVANGRDTAFIEKPAASILTAVTTVILFHLATEILSGSVKRRRRNALLACLVFAFATGAWSTASLAFWSHGPSLLLVSGALLALMRMEQSRRWAVIAGISMAGAYAVRPSNLVVVGGLFAWALLFRRRRVPYLAGGALGVLVPFFAVNLATFAKLLPAYYDNGRLQLLSGTPEALAGLLVSPSRGLFIFTPVALLSVYGVWKSVRTKRLTSLYLILASIVVLYWGALGLFDHWWGGSSFGPRLFTDMLPLFFVLALPTVDALDDRSISKSLRMLTAILVIYSGVINAGGAVLRASWCWNSDPVHVDAQPSRLWDWGDSQAIRGWNVLVRSGPAEAIGRRCSVVPLNVRDEVGIRPTQ